MGFKEEFNKHVSNSKKIAIISHLIPDGDAISSCLAILSYIKANYPDKDTTVFFESKPVPNYAFLQYYSQITWIENLPEHLDTSFDTVVFLDATELKRFTMYPDKFNIQSKTVIGIDHHIYVNGDFALYHNQTTVSSTSELIYLLLYKDRPDLINHRTAELILTGILTDSGFFKYISPLKANTLIVTSELIKSGGIDLELLTIKLNGFTQTEFELYSFLIKNTIFFDTKINGKCVYSYLPMEVLNKYTDLEITNASNLFKVNILRMVDGFLWGFDVVPKNNSTFKVSFRSIKGAPNAALIARNFNGGGHIHAAACTISVDSSNKTPLDIINNILKFISNQKLELS